MRTLILHLHQTEEAAPYNPSMVKPYPIQVDLMTGMILSGDPGDTLIAFAPTAEIDPTGNLILRQWENDGADVEALVGKHIVTSQRGNFMQDRRPIERAEVRS